MIVHGEFITRFGEVGSVSGGDDFLFYMREKDERFLHIRYEKRPTTE
jgi:hypothetical protein